MEEQILKIIRKPIFPKTINGEKLNCDAQEAAAIEIKSHVFEFVEWVIGVIAAGTYPNKPYINCDTDEFFKSLEEVYQYWLNNVKNN